MKLETRRARLVALHHLSRSAPDMNTAVRDLVALHSSDPLSPHLGLWARVPLYQTWTLETSALWRGHAMRRTLWVAEPGEVALLDAAVGRKVAEKERKRLTGQAGAAGQADGWLDDLATRALDFVAATPGVSTRELTKAVPGLSTKVTVGSGKWTQQAAVSSRLMQLLAMELKIARTSTTGSWKSSQYGWRTFVPDAAMDPVEARDGLMRRYLERFGPVTLVDAAWWTGLTKAQTRKALAAVGVEMELDEGTGWMLPDAVEVGATGVTLLPGLDPTPMGYKERGWFLGDYGPKLFDRNGNIGPSIWVDGRVVGGWAVSEGRVLTRLFEATRDAEIQVEVEALTQWLGGVTVTPRFRTPLEKGLTG
jgi:hypothetical protein